MKNAIFILFIGCITIYSTKAKSEINLTVKIAQVIGNKKVETVKNISGNYGRDIVVFPEGNMKEKVVFNLTKIKDILVNGNKINPVQVDMKIVNELKNIVGKTKTVTSFYNNSAQFDAGDLNIFLNFEEI
jgi:hypothetical protein